MQNDKTIAYKTRTEIVNEKNERVGGTWEIGLDIGYSGVKLFSPNKHGCFPAYAKLVGDSFEFAGKNPSYAIMYKDLKSGEVWLVGEAAQNLVSNRDTSDSEATLYGRDRYNNNMFHAYTEAGLGIAMMKNEFAAPDKNDNVVIQTGLPERYLIDDAPDLIDALSGEHHFAIKVGAGEWTTFKFTVNPEDVFVISQPKGTLLNICIDQKGHFRPDSEELLKSSLLIFDPGFGTLDIYAIKAGAVERGETFPEFGMKRVLQETSISIKENLHIDIPVYAMQPNLATGMVTYSDRKNFISQDYDFSDLLEAATKKVCEGAISKLATAFDLSKYRRLVLTGGTSMAWCPIIKDKFKQMTTLEVVMGNINDGLPTIYSNCRGYYFYRYNKLRKGLK